MSRQLANKTASKPIIFSDKTVPDLKGLSLREVLKKIQGKELKLKIHGSGRLVRTIPFAGEPLPENKKITLIFD